MFKTKSPKAIAAAALSIAALFVLAACELTGTATFSWDSVNNPSGQVKNAYTGENIADVELTLTYISGAPEDEEPSQDFTGTSGSDGYSVSGNVPYGTYVLKGQKDGYAFIDQRIELSPDNKDLPDMIGVPAEDEYTLSIVALWSETYGDVDAYVTFPEFDVDGWKGEADDMVDPYDTSNASVGTVETGFLLGGASGREIVEEEDNPHSEVRLSDIFNNGTTDSVVQLRYPATSGPGPETAVVRAVPVDWGGKVAYNVTGDADTNMLPSGNYAWVGVLEYYLHGDSGLLMEQGDSATESGANVTIYVTQNESVLAKYRLPEFTDIEGASVLRINLFGSDGADFFQVVPDMRLVAEESNGSFVPASATNDSGILNVPGRPRK